MKKILDIFKKKEKEIEYEVVKSVWSSDVCFTSTRWNKLRHEDEPEKGDKDE